MPGDRQLLFRTGYAGRTGQMSGANARHHEDGPTEAGRVGCR